MFRYLLWALVFSLLINLTLFMVAFIYKTDKLTDASYAASFIVVAGAGLMQAPLTPYRVALAAMVGLWAIRLGGFLLLRIWVAGKDSRFDDIRSNFWKFGKFWVSQGFTVWVVLLPVLLALQYKGTHLSWLCFVGIAGWAGGLAIESLADVQKFIFSLHKSNKNKWIESGLWHYSRHPNYFGEICVWIGIFVYSSVALSLPETVVGVLSPLFITWLLLFVSGVPILERQAEARWGKNAAFQTYKHATSLLVPLPKRRP